MTAATIVHVNLSATLDSLRAGVADELERELVSVKKLQVKAGVEHNQVRATLDALATREFGRDCYIEALRRIDMAIRQINGADYLEVKVRR